MPAIQLLALQWAVRETHIYTCSGTARQIAIHLYARTGVARELALTARTIDGAEAERVGLVSRCLPDDAAMLAAAEWTAVEIAAKSPLTVTGTKRIMLHSRCGLSDA